MSSPGPAPFVRRPCRWLPAALLAAAWPAAATSVLPPEVSLALQRARVPEQALHVVLEEAGSARSRLAWQDDRPVNPASIKKLVTTYAALDRLGPGWSWRTPVWLLGDRRDGGVLEGSLVIRGSGDPTLVVERLWLLLRRVQQLGVREIRGDIVLDRSAFELPAQSPGQFDGEPLRPYNAQPDALLLNYKSVVYGFVPEPASGRARVTVVPPLAGVVVDRSVPLAPGPCGDWRAALKASFTVESVQFAGSYASACGELQWPVADPQPRSYNARLIEGLWREMGGQLTGKVREGSAPSDRAPTFEWVSPALAEVVRDINKFSNNVMAEQLFLTLGLDGGATSSPERARAWMQRWLAPRLGAAAESVVLDSGSGLSRDARISAAALARLLQQAWASPVMPELMASLPASGVDGTLRRSSVGAGRAHLKTGSLRDVNGIAGIVLSDTGRRYVLVAIVNHANAPAARPALDALVRWALADGPAR
jgi:serine-type D-Ala-D-Ala carboxypeptidase/endopeptidase (penicillin-binding protein 4)